MKKLLMTPGPTNVPEEIRKKMAEDVIHHRMADYKKLFSDVSENLKHFFKTKQEVLTLTCSGTGVMEAAVVNLFSKKEKVLVINTGNFGQRFVEIATTYDLDVVELKYNWGSTYDLEDVKKVILNNPDLKGILMTHSETSTGVLNDIQSVGDLTKDTNILLVVDSISGMVVNPLEFDLWSLDCVIAGSQKGFLLPPGLAFVALSEKAKKAIERSNLPKFYFDLKKYIKFLKEKQQNPYTPAITLVVGLKCACDLLLEEGLDSIQLKHTKLRKYLGEELIKLGFEYFVKDEKARGNTLVAVTHKKIENMDDFRGIIDKNGISIAGGQGNYTGKLLRIGCLGKITKIDIDRTIDEIKKVLV
ncbi:MAG: alanine--glyoxylate aminotransferase family protein [Psychrilyobacter sp.]|uniref:pyridoxal-phosphate-dependent aminotransferase family protein n=1 Tax=Psychrilyobacter sp. TaxID=2586924 RepID=UPI003C70D36E